MTGPEAAAYYMRLQKENKMNKKNLDNHSPAANWCEECNDYCRYAPATGGNLPRDETLAEQEWDNAVYTVRAVQKRLDQFLVDVAECEQQLVEANKVLDYWNKIVQLEREANDRATL